MQWTLLLSALSAISTINARPGHQHHAREALPEDEIVYMTHFVTQYITETAAGGLLPGTYLSMANQPKATPLAGLLTAVNNIAQAIVPTTPAKPITTPAKTPSTLRTATSAPAASAAPVSSGGKKGIAWPSENKQNMASLFGKADGIHWYFNWNSRSSPGMTAEFLPQQWSLDNMANVNNIAKGSTLLGFNEPDAASQATMSAAQAAAAYQNTLVPLRKSGAIGLLTTPAITNGGSGLPWLQEFMTLASNGGFADSIDVIQIHWYGPNMDLLKTQLQAVHAAFPTRKVWLTEFAATNWNAAGNPSAADVKTFMGQAVPYLESLDWLEKYAWFGALQITDNSLGRQNMLVTSDGNSLSDLGKYYLSL
ncbi:glycosyl hydrolase catalytic core-domain-containing protein [Protomyces lactucae-debilis]|uniref:Glycosyl hydrolase catalytic core-domain-containing protein n=1 Tax=Protomyces lactucae-debilis TaxID=2754530 RepID=A0A1Y2F0Y4_PROLT|nr:glycosyl hydrolase catalytic core-domain-containing protein [Protomyces lactucae-debilis]ORY77367.1 glycosyl hydrolase catalytic core-domain-containing protein [Protomyces lactucae-debilis]